MDWPAAVTGMVWHGADLFLGFVSTSREGKLGPTEKLPSLLNLMGPVPGDSDPPHGCQGGPCTAGTSGAHHLVSDSDSTLSALCKWNHTALVFVFLSDLLHTVQ